MKTLTLHSSIEPFTIEIGDTVINAEIDLSDDGLDELLRLMREGQEKVKTLNTLINKDGGNAEKHKKDMADILRGVIAPAIGQESYDAILKACGNGHDLKPENANVAMTHVFLVVCQALAERGDEMKASKERVAHYLTGVMPDAQPIADTAVRNA